MAALAPSSDTAVTGLEGARIAASVCQVTPPVEGASGEPAAKVTEG
jgi:hypothetical protein